VNALTDLGRKIEYSKGVISVDRVIGEGSYGIVYQGNWQTPNGDIQDVVLKRVKYHVEDADQMAHFEHLFNAYLTKEAKGSIAEFIGYFNVDTQVDSSIPTGKWLVWKYEGDKTLSYFLNRRDCDEALGLELDVSYKSVVATVIKQVLECVKKLHKVGIIHRDLKPSNIIFVDNKKKLKLIDLGACADLRQGTNYVPDESILDPLYCPPEDFVLPTTTPDISKQSYVVSMAMSPLLWSRHMPDRFDTYSIGVIMMQLAIPALRSDQGLRNFNMALKRARYDLARWRKTQRGISEAEFQILDEDDGAGFELASALLRERGSKSGILGSIRRSRKARLSVNEALRHPFLAKADMKPTAEETARYLKRKSDMKSPSAGSGKKRGLFWRLFDLEAKLNIKASNTERQTLKVKRLEEELKSGKGSEGELKEAKKTLKVMESGLNRLLTDFETAADDAKETLRTEREQKAKQTPKRGVADTQAKKNVATSGKSAVDDLEIENQQLKEKLRDLEQKLDKSTKRTIFDPKQVKEEVTALALEAEAEKDTVSASKSTKMLSEESDDSVTRAASGLLKFGIGFTGLAMKVAGDIALDLRKAALKTLEPTIDEEKDIDLESLDAVEARSMLTANPKDLSASEIRSGTRKLTKFKSAMESNLKAQQMFVSRQKSEITDAVSKSGSSEGVTKNKDGKLKEKMNTLQWLKTVQASMQQEYKAVMDKISEMEKALESLGDSNNSGGGASSSSVSSRQSMKLSYGGTRKIRNRTTH